MRGTQTASPHRCAVCEAAGKVRTRTEAPPGQDQRPRSTSTKSMRAPPRPASAPTTVRMAVAVRPLRPITLPMSAGCTRTSSTAPRRSSVPGRPTSSGLLHDASDQVLERLGEHRPRPRRSSARSLGGLGGAAARRPGSPREPRRRAPRPASARGRPRRARPSWQRSSWPTASGLGPWRLGLSASLKISACRAPARGSAGCRGRQALELLPVTGDLQEHLDGLGRLGADAEPVLRPLGDEVDDRRLAPSGGTCRSPRSPCRPASCGSRRRRRGSRADGSCPCASSES